jgi:hypothetical protein
VKVLMLLLAIILCSIEPGCKKQSEQNQVDFDQIDVDNSTDYRYIFRDKIKEEKFQNDKKKKKTFRE